MRDLYKKLGLSRSCSVEDIQVAIATCKNKKLFQDAEAVLLNEKNRKTYDKNHKVLTSIGKLRAELGLSQSENWYGDTAHEFSQEPNKPGNYYSSFRRKIKPSIKDHLKDFLKSAFDYVMVLVKLVASYALGIGILFGVLFGIGGIWEALDPPSKTAKVNNTNKVDQPVFDKPVLQLPVSGVVRRHSNAESIAPLEIRTSEGGNYLVKVESASTGLAVMDVFVRGGDRVEVDVPLGDYVIKYASGGQWYGYEHLFGPSTSYNKANETFSFVNNGYQISGYTITLYQVRNGNLTTSRLSPSDF